MWKCGFGYGDAPKRWGDKFAKDQVKLGAKRCSLDPCIYVWYDDASDEIIGVVGVHVDDARMTGNAKWFATVWPQEKELYEWGEWEEMQFRFTGVTHKGEVGKWASLDMEHYISHCKPLELDNIGHLIEPNQNHLERGKRKLNKQGFAIFRAVAADAWRLSSSL